MSAEHPVIAAVKWILESRFGGIMSRLDKTAGLTKGHTEHLLKGRVPADVKRDVAIAYARAGNVRLEWLLTGAGPREPFVEPSATSPAGTDPYPSRVQFLTLGGKTLDPDVVQALRDEQCDGGDPGEDYWPKRYVELRERKRSILALEQDDGTAEVLAKRKRMR